MNRFRYVVRSFFYFWRVNLAVCLGVVAATAVLTGALLVGDSMRGSLRKIALDGLGNIDEILLTDRFFREGLAEDIRVRNEEFSKQFESAQPVILFPNASASFKEKDDLSVANKVTLIGCRNEFWRFSSDKVQPKTTAGVLPDFEATSPTSINTPVVINEPLASDLGIAASDLGKDEPPVLTVQIPRPQLINADNPIGKKEDLYETIARLEVVDIIPAESIGRFKLFPSQHSPRILYLPITTVQEALRQEGMANAILVSLNEQAANSRPGTTPEQSKLLNSLLHPQSSDLGLLFKKVEQTVEVDQQKKTAFEYTSLSSDRLLLNDTEVELAMKTFAEYQPQKVLTYLANYLRMVDGKSEAIPFSMVSAIDFTEQFQLQSAITDNPIGPLSDEQIVINSWVAEDLLTTAGVNVKALSTTEYLEKLKSLVGKNFEVEFFEPEASHGKLIFQKEKFVIADIAKLVVPKVPFNRRRAAKFDRLPTMANDPDLTPFVPGVTDQNSVNKWDLPFKTDVRPEGQDDDYWQFYRTTPKAFINLKTGQRLWKSRFGQVTSIRIHSGAEDAGKLDAAFADAAQEILPKLGFQFTPIKRKTLEASSGSTPFDVLFLALSFFIIASALILISLLFRLGVDQKVSQLGLLSAVGLHRRYIARLLIWEGAIVSIVGAAVGILFGVLYARLMVYGLTTWWVDAVMTDFMQYHWSVQSLVIGAVTGVLVSILTIWVSVRRLGEIPVRDMLSGKTETGGKSKSVKTKWLAWVSRLSFVFALALSVVAATSLGGEAQAGAFMGGGFLMLTSFLTLIWLYFKRPAREFKQMSAMHLAVQNASRNPLRSTLTIGLVASATFLIVGVSSFHLAPTAEGTGGFEFMGESSRPIVGDFQDPEVRADLLGESQEELSDLQIYSIRFLPGDEAGCNNPFQAQRPQVLGVTDAFVDLFSRSDSSITGFAWAGSTAKSEAEKANPWSLVQQETDDQTVPVVIDKNTAMYSLKIFGVGGTYDVEFDGGQKVTFRVVGFLSNSTLQGSLIIGEKQFERIFPNVSGYRKYLIRFKEGQSKQDAAISRLEAELANFGFDASDSAEVLASFLAVQNTYLSTFQTLGAFGLLLGTFGLATVQMRNVVERRKELALMRALGFTKSKLGSIVMSEHSALLLAGILVGTISALFSVVPHILFGDATVPLLLLGLVLFSILVIGLISGLGAVVASAKTPILTALRSDD